MTATNEVSAIEPQGKGVGGELSLADINIAVKMLYNCFANSNPKILENDMVAQHFDSSTIQNVRKDEAIGNIKVTELTSGKVRILRNNYTTFIDSTRRAFLIELLGDENRLDPSLENLSKKTKPSSSATLTREELSSAVENLANKYGIVEEIKAAVANARNANIEIN